MIILTLLMLLSPARADLPTHAQILKIQGEVTFDGKPLTAPTALTTAGDLETKAGSARIELLPSRAILMLGANSRIHLAPARRNGATDEELLQGTARFQVPPRDMKDPKSKPVFFAVRGHSASLGVRGTDFMAVSNPVFGETEVVVFEGSVEMDSKLDTADKKLVPKEHWGGVGGRFGKKIGELIHLPQATLDSLGSATLIP
ncbi:MAG: FecR domain-containing protein [Bdellovibrionota bacterium]